MIEGTQTTDGMVLKCVEKSIASFENYPPDSEYQKGFLAAMKSVKDEYLTINDPNPLQNVVPFGR